jgi:hypothetical protein
VRLVAPHARRGAGKLEVRLVYERGRLERAVPAALSAASREMSMGDGAKLVIRELR